MKRRLALALAFFLSPIAVFGATFTSVTNGPWTSGPTWDLGSPPTSSDDVVINHDVAVVGPVTANSVTLNNGSINGAGSVTVPVFNWSNGKIGTGGTTVTVTGTGTISGLSNLHHVANATFVNQGTTTWTSGAGEIRVESGGVFNNMGTFDIQTDAGIRNFAGGGPVMINSGTIRKSGGA